MGKIKDANIIIQDFQTGYIECLLWTDEESTKELVSDHGRDWEEFDWSVDQLTQDAKTRIREVVEDFVMDNLADVQEYIARGQLAYHVGHDFALSQNGHGTGFWDRGMGELGDRLHKVAKTFGYARLDL